MPTKKYADKNGYLVSIHYIRGRNTFCGLIESTPRLLRRYRLHIAETEMQEKTGLYYWGLEQLRHEIETSEPSWPPTMDWPPKFLWEADVCSYGYIGRVNDKFFTETKSLIIRWFSDDDQPLVFLREIIKSIDFLALCKTTIEEDD